MNVYIICEGATEGAFVRDVLAPFYGAQNTFLHARILGKVGAKGGNLTVERLKYDIRATLRSQKGSYCTTLFDYYGLPRDFPGKEMAAKVNGFEERANLVEEAVKKEVELDIGSGLARRFIPYVQMYEFEGLLFSEPECLATSIKKRELGTHFQAIRQAFESPEHINDSPQTAPSKRILAHFPRYQKPLDGVRAAQTIGLQVIRRECHRFDAWLKRIEELKL